MDIRPITECPVDTRIEMFAWFPKLFEESESVAKSYVPRINKAVEEFERNLFYL